MTNPNVKTFSVRDLWGCLNPLGFDRGVFLLFKTFIDESYDNKTFVLSCSAGPGERWERFTSEWRDVLSETNEKLASKGRTLLSRYHASDCNGCFKEFEGWNIGEQKALTASLIEALRKVPMQSVAYTVLLDDLRTVAMDRLGQWLSDDNAKTAAYMLTTQHCLMELGELTWSLNPYLRVSVIHDHCDYDEVMLRAFNHVKYTLNPPYAALFSTIAPMTSKECLPLQLADFLAFEFFRERGGEESKGDAYIRRKSLDLTLQTGTGVNLRTLSMERIGEIMDYALRGSTITE